MSEPDLSRDVDPFSVLDRLIGGPDEAVASLYERYDGSASDWQDAQSVFKAVKAAIASRYGKPDVDVSRKQGLAGAPASIDPKWRFALVWQLPGRKVYTTLSGSETTPSAIELVVSADN
ncbi:MAG: hypothetical protein AAFY53_03165 [Pseudomonadota bacterium]